LTLHEGKLVFRIDYGGESQLEINTTNRYNTGKWVNVEAARQFTPKRNTENGSLKVDNEEPQTGSPTKPVTQALLPVVSKSDFYLGGVPPGFKSGTTKAPGADNAFFGCLRDIQINGEIFDPLDSQSYFGVEPSCKETITKAGFNGNGYVELPSHSLRKRANFAFVFRTLQSDALLLFSGFPPQTIADYDSKDVRGNFSVSLVNGHIHVWVDAGKGRVELESNLTLNDGEFHVVNVNKIGRKFELRINDDLQTTKTLSATPALVNSPEDFGGLFLGGVPEFPEFDNLAPTFNGLQGAIKDVVFNNKTVSFNDVMSFKNVHIGGLGPSMGLGSPLLMKTEPIGQKFKEATEGCQRVSCAKVSPLY
jgi:laminin, alpha 1/2